MIQKNFFISCKFSLTCSFDVEHIISLLTKLFDYIFWVMKTMMLSPHVMSHACDHQ